MFYLSVDKIGNRLLERYIDVDGVEKSREIDYTPTLFLPTIHDSPYKDIFGQAQLPKMFDTMRDADDYIRLAKDRGATINGMEDYVLAYISDRYVNREFDMSKIRVANIDIETPSIEFPNAIEAKYEITSIGHHDSIKDKYFVWGIPTNEEWSKEKSELDPALLEKVEYIRCTSEKELLIRYLQFWRQFTPAVVTGWNIETFDLPYIVNRMEKVLGKKVTQTLSPWNKVNKRTITNDYGQESMKINIVGVAELDYLQLYKKFTFITRPSYKLDYVGEVEVGQKKVEFEQANYLEFYKQDYKNFIDYQIQDVQLVNRIDTKLMLLNLAFSISYYAGINFTSVFGTLKPWDAIIFNSLKKDKKVVPMSKHQESASFMGAFVKAPQVGFHKSIGSFDLTSLYPSIIRECNISPETIVRQYDYVGQLADRVDLLVGMEIGVPDDGNSHSANGMCYRKDIRGVIPVEIEKVFFERKANKKKSFEHQQNALDAQAELKDRGKFDKFDGLSVEDINAYYKESNSLATQFDVQQMARKILINSLYGAQGHHMFRYYDLRNAEAVTSYGQLAIKWVSRDVNVWMNKMCGTEDVDYVVYTDTDSIYVGFETLMNKLGMYKLEGDAFTDKFSMICEKIETNVINPSYQHLHEYMNTYERQMFMDREVLANTGFFIAKKRYALDVQDNEGIRKPKLKIMGIETQRSSTPPLAQKGLKESIRLILQQGEDAMQAYVKDFRDDFMKAEYQQISFVSSANNMGKYSNVDGTPGKGCPGHVKAALYYNKIAKDLGFNPIEEGDKIAVVFLDRNEYGIDRIAYPSGGKLPRELNHIVSAVDRRRLYDDKFIAPLNKICDAIKWEHKKSNNLSAFFG
ncbi:DNA polymerase [Vibrio phage D479]